MLNFNVQVDCIPLLVLVIFIAKDWSRLSSSPSIAMYRYNLVALIGVLFFEMAIVFCQNLEASFWSVYFLRLAVLCFFICIALFYMFWGFFIITYIYRMESKSFFRRQNYMVMVLTGILIAIFVANVYFGFIYYIDDYGVYTKGSGYNVFFFIFAAYSYLFSLLGYIYSFRLVKGSYQKKGLTFFFWLSVMMETASNVQFLKRNQFSPWVINCLFMLVLYFFLQRENAIMDVLTGIGNRRCFEEIMGRKFADKDVNSIWLLAVLDVDSFKYINDTFGHDAGDTALILMSRALLKTFSLSESTVFRFGGDEFAIVFDSPDRESLERQIVQLRKELARPFEVGQGLYHSLSFSIGVAEFQFGRFASPKAMIVKADEMLYHEKAEKKGRI
jgi:diguanylate cyclase (GGDEF) domain